MRVHARTVGVEDADHADIDAVLAAVVRAERFGGALALVVAAPEADRVHVAPVGLRLRMHVRIAVALGSGGVEDAGLGLERELEGVHHAEDRRLGGLDRVVLVVDWRSGAGQVVDFVELPPERLRHVVDEKREARVVHQVVEVGLGAGEEVVQDRHFGALREKRAREVGADEAGAAGDETFFRVADHFGKFSAGECGGFAAFPRSIATNRREVTMSRPHSRFLLSA